MPVKVSKQGGKYRITEAATGHIVKRKGSAVDGGGHRSKERAQRQTRAINASLKRKGKI